MKRIISLLIFFILMPSHAQDCSLIRNNAERLNCYDSNSSIQNVEADNQGWSGNTWDAIATTSPLDDSQIVSIAKFSEGLLGGKGQPGLLLISCTKDNVEVKVSSDYPLGESKLTRVSYRFDQETPESGTWITINDSVFAPNSKLFIKGMMGKKNLYIESPKSKGSFFGLYFNISGLREAIAPFKESCKIDI